MHGLIMNEEYWEGIKGEKVYKIDSSCVGMSENVSHVEYSV